MAEGDLANLQFVVVGLDNYQTNFAFKSTSDVAGWRTIVMDGFVTLVVPLLMAGLSELIQLVEVRMQDIVPGTEPDDVHSFGALPFGGKSGPPVPANVCGKIVWRTALQGRSYRGYNYLAGMAASSLTDDASRWGIDGEGYLSDIREVMGAAYGPDGTSTFARHVVISRQLNGVARPLPVGTEVVNSYSVLSVRTQRRRIHD